MKFLFDTNVYLHLLHDRSQLDQYTELLSRILPRTWLSSVVLHEMLAGARGDLGRAAVRRAVRSLERVDRTVTPTHRDWTDAAVTRGKIWEEAPRLRTKNLQNDLLLAFAARRIGAFIVTDNERDFGLIARHIDVDHGPLETLV